MIRSATPGPRLPGFGTAALLFASCVTLDKILNLSGPQCPHLPIGDNHRSLPTGLLLGTNELI